MSQPLKQNTQMSLGRASLLLTALIFLSRIVGFARLQLTSYFYGTTPEANAFNAAFAIPETMSIVIAGGALATGFVPTFSSMLQSGNDDRARHTFRALLTLLFGAVGVLTLVLIALTYSSALNFLVPENASADLYFRILRVLLLAQWIFIIGGVFSGAFNSLRHFWMPALQPVFFNVGIVALGWWGASRNLGIEWQAWGAVLGALIGSVVLQIPAAWRVGLSTKPLFDFRDEGVQKVLRALVPVFFGLASGRILALQLPVMASAEPSAITNASRLAILPLELLASGSAIALFPTLSALAARGETEEVRKQLSSMMRQTLKRLLVAMILLFVLAFPIVKLLFQYGKFSQSDANLTAQVLMICALALPALGVQQLLARGFFALGDNRTPVVAGLSSMLVFGVLVVLVKALNFGTLGVTGASVIALTLLAAMLWRGLERKLGKL